MKETPRRRFTHWKPISADWYSLVAGTAARAYLVHHVGPRLLSVVSLGDDSPPSRCITRGCSSEEEEEEEAE